MKAHAIAISVAFISGAAALVPLAACSSSSPSSGGAEVCGVEVAPGTYTSTATGNASNAATCPPASELTLVSEVDGGPEYVPSGCTCSGSTMTCSETTPAGTTQTVQTFTSAGSNGTISIQMGDAAACNYTFTQTK